MTIDAKQHASCGRRLAVLPGAGSGRDAVIEGSCENSPNLLGNSHVFVPPQYTASLYNILLHKPKNEHWVVKFGPFPKDQRA